MSMNHAATVLQIPGMNPTSKHLLLTLAICADWHGNGQLIPRDIAHLTGLAPRTIRDHLGTLARQGLIEARPYSHDYRVIETACRNLVR